MQPLYTALRASTKTSYPTTAFQKLAIPFLKTTQYTLDMLNVARSETFYSSCLTSSTTPHFTQRLSEIFTQKSLRPPPSFFSTTRPILVSHTLLLQLSMLYPEIPLSSQYLSYFSIFHLRGTFTAKIPLYSLYTWCAPFTYTSTRLIRICKYVLDTIMFALQNKTPCKS